MRAFFEAVHQHRFHYASTLCDDEGLQLFRDDWLRIPQEAMRSSDSTALNQTLAQVAPGREPSALSPSEFLEFWFAWEAAKRPSAYERFGRFQIIGSVTETEDRAYVVYRSGDDAEIPLPVSLLAVSRTSEGWQLRLKENLVIPGYATAVGLEL